MRLARVALLGSCLLGCSSSRTTTVDSSAGDATIDIASVDSADAGALPLDAATADAKQAPITIVATNLTSDVVYIDSQWGERGIFSCALQSSGAWDACSFFSPGCMEQCSAENQGQDCCMGCSAPMPTVAELLPGDAVSTTWTGEAWEMVTDHCSDGCSCYWVVAAPAGRYRAEVCVYDSYSCSGDCPEPHADGVVLGASPDGSKTCHSTELELPYAGGPVEIAIE